MMGIFGRTLIALKGIGFIVLNLLERQQGGVVGNIGTEIFLQKMWAGISGLGDEIWQNMKRN